MFFQVNAILLLPLACVGCISLQQTEDQVAVREPGSRVIEELRPFRPQAMRHIEYAWLSQSAYEKIVSPQEPPSQCQNSEKALEKWKQWDGFPLDVDLKNKIRDSHLRVEVWSKESPPQVVVAFGGTVFNNQNDWLANLRWFIPFHDDQYTLVVKALAPAFVQEFKNRTKHSLLNDAKPTIISVGHSLGGGLAQQFAYALPLDTQVPRVSTVYVFNPSPVTGYFSVKESTREINARGLKIERIYERGEILAILRSIQSVFFEPSALNPEITGYRYNVVHNADPIKDHSLSNLTCAISNKLAQQDQSR